MNHNSLAQLLPCDRRMGRKAEKERLLLRFLRDEIYSCADVLGLLLGVESRQAVHKTLSRCERTGLLRRETVTLGDGSRKAVWGITAHGQGWACDPSLGEGPSSRNFEPTRIALSVLDHNLDVQRLRILAERGGWTEWQNGDRVSRWKKDAKRPDALAVDPQGRLVAVEVERTFKTPKRYEIILASYLRSIKMGEISRVIWVSPTRDFSERLAALIKGIKDVPIASEKVKIDPERHHENLYFCDYRMWPKI